MRVHYLQHVAFEGLGSIADWLSSAGYEVTHTRLFEAAELPKPNLIDLLVVMGGPMSVNDEQKYPWLVQEKGFVRDVIKAGIPMLGVCLGAQLIASALGARIYPNAVKEIGWYSVQGITSNDAALFRFPSTTDVFHWHGETFDLPPGATLIASSEVCENQAFQIGSSVIGLQFHLETTAESARDIVTNCRDELVPAPYIQTEEQILAASAEQFAAINQLMAQVLAFLTCENT